LLVNITESASDQVSYIYSNAAAVEEMPINVKYQVISASKNPKQLVV
jgi:hypothetical protein